MIWRDPKPGDGVEYPLPVGRTGAAVPALELAELGDRARLIGHSRPGREREVRDDDLAGPEARLLLRVPLQVGRTAGLKFAVKVV